jgi:hypothetical protein
MEGCFCSSWHWNCTRSHRVTLLLWRCNFSSDGTRKRIFLPSAANHPTLVSNRNEPPTQVSSQGVGRLWKWHTFTVSRRINRSARLPSNLLPAFTAYPRAFLWLQLLCNREQNWADSRRSSSAPYEATFCTDSQQNLLSWDSCLNRGGINKSSNNNNNNNINNKSCRLYPVFSKAMGAGLTDQDTSWDYLNLIIFF